MFVGSISAMPTVTVKNKLCLSEVQKMCNGNHPCMVTILAAYTAHTIRVFSVDGVFYPANSNTVYIVDLHRQYDTVSTTTLEMVHYRSTDLLAEKFLMFAMNPTNGLITYIGHSVIGRVNQHVSHCGHRMSMYPRYHYNWIPECILLPSMDVTECVNVNRRTMAALLVCTPDGLYNVPLSMGILHSPRDNTTAWATVLWISRDKRRLKKLLSMGTEVGGVTPDSRLRVLLTALGCRVSRKSIQRSRSTALCNPAL